MEQDPVERVLDVFGSKPILARVESFDYLVDDSNTQVLDGNQNPIPTGLLNISFLEKGGGREKVPFLLPVSGNTAFMGGLPELGTLCVVAFRQGNDPIILGFLPPSIHGVVAGRQVLPNLVPGEVLMQGSIPDFDVQAQENFFLGARVWLDRYGRVRVETVDYELIAGYLLSNEFTPGVAKLVDPVTQNPIFMREKVKGVERRVDDVGNAFFSYPATVTTAYGGDKTSTIAGKETKTYRKGFLWDDGKGNTIELKETGELVILLGSGSFTKTVQANVTEESAANHNDVVGANYGKVVGEDSHEVVGGDVTIQVGGNRKVTVVTGSSSEHVILGKKIIEAVLGIFLGSEFAVDQALLGTTYRVGESTMNGILVTTFSSLAAASTGVLAPLAAGFTAISSAIQAFETSAPTYLSKSVKLT